MKTARSARSIAIHVLVILSVLTILMTVACRKKPDGKESDDATPGTDVEETRNDDGRPTGSLPSLQASLDIAKARFAESFPPEKAKIFQGGIDKLRESGIAQKALKVGDRAEEFDLPNATRKTVKLAKLLEKGPVVITWYRGGWCPYCNLELAAFQRALPEIRKYGATLVAISPELPDNSLNTIEKTNLEFEVLSDAGNKVARKYGLVFRLSDEVAEQLKGFVDLEKYNGDKSNELPIPATYVIGTDGKIHFAFVDPDYRNRAEPDDIIATLRKLKKK